MAGTTVSDVLFSPFFSCVTLPEPVTFTRSPSTLSSSLSFSAVCSGQSVFTARCSGGFHSWLSSGRSPSLAAELAKFSLKRPASKSLRLYGPHSLRCNAAIAMQTQTRKDVNEQAWLCSNETETGGGLVLVHRTQMARLSLADSLGKVQKYNVSRVFKIVLLQTSQLKNTPGLDVSILVHIFSSLSL